MHRPDSSVFMNPERELVFGIPFSVTSSDEAEQHVRGWLNAGRYFTLAFANPEFLLVAERDSELTSYLSKCAAVFADGVGIIWASRIQGGQIRERITGTDFQWRLFRIAEEQNLRLMIYGGRPGAAFRALNTIRARCPSLAMGCCDGFVPEEEALREIQAFRPDVLMVCLGNPRQERWHGRATGARLVFANGGAVDFLAGTVSRAPSWMIEQGMEWLWRLLQDLSWTRISRQFGLRRFVWKLIKLRFQKR
jgi:N-acetylglucosaminyldiphosphoundecaprenol N-acetyl-beta-D-mannosaminyltransferase